MTCASCGDSGVVNVPGECGECHGLCVLYRNGLGVECLDCDGTGWMDFIECPDCDGALGARLAQKRRSA